MKRVVSFALWGDSPTYLRGAVENIKRREEFYPGWTTRIYYDETVPQDRVQALKELDPSAEWILKGNTSPGMGLFWRFEPMFDDPDIDRFVVRDFDSFFSERETAAVNEWIESGYDWHIMRDNPGHGIQILGGTWGAIAGCVPNFRDLMANFIAGRMQRYVAMNVNNSRGPFHGTDQCFLGDCIWPVIKDRQIAHITENNEALRFHENDRYFSVPMKDGHYVGMVYQF